MTAAILLLLGACAAPTPTPEETLRGVAMAVDDKRLEQAEKDVGNWLTYGQTYAEDRYSRLDQVSTDNVDDLGLAWAFDTGMRGGIEATPLVVDGTMYVTGPWSIVYALDARTGALLWRWDPEVPRLRGLIAVGGPANRGLALYRGKVYVGTLDGRLLALDAATGIPVWSVATFDPETSYTITGAPRVVQGNVIIGNGGAEFGVRGYVSAYDAETGEMVWRTYTVPGNPANGFESRAMEEASKTWSGEWWVAGGGGTAWDAIVYDPELDLLYVGTGNGSPWSRNQRSPGGGDNLFLSSILALNPSDGAYRWHFQTTPGDNWDYTATQPLLLANLMIGGEERKVIMQAPKNGFFFVVDRETGAFISAEPYVSVTWADGVDPKSGRPMERMNVGRGPEPAEVQPSYMGGHNWQPMAFNHETGYVYLPVHETSATFADDPAWVFRKGWNIGSSIGAGSFEQHGALLAWDPVAQREVWRVPLAHWWNGGVLTTSGDLVFHGGGDGRFVAYDARRGNVLWTSDTGLGIIGSPITFLVDGEQYVTVAVGWGGAPGRKDPSAGEALRYHQRGRILTFKLGGTAPMPPLALRPLNALVPDIDLPSDPETIANGRSLFQWRCQHCHGAAGASQGTFPNLQEASQATHEAFQQIVRGGILEPLGMPSFAELLSEDEARAIQAYIVSEAKATAQGPLE